MGRARRPFGRAGFRVSTPFDTAAGVRHPVALPRGLLRKTRSDFVAKSPRKEVHAVPTSNSLLRRRDTWCIRVGEAATAEGGGRADVL